MAVPNIGLMLSTTLKNYRKKLVDNIFESNATFYKLKDVGAVKEEAGGERIQAPVMYGENTTSGSYSGYELLDTTPQDGIDSAEYNWKQYSVSITISGEELRKNAGNKWKIIDILEAKTKQSRMSLTAALTAGLFSNGTGNGARDLTGLEAMVQASGTYGGIDSAAHTWWRAGEETTSEALAFPKMRTAFNSASVGGTDAPDLIVTTQTLFEKYESLFTADASSSLIRTPSAGQKKMADGGFETLSFKGVPIVWDESAPSGTMYFLNTDHMNLTVHKDANFDTTEFVKPTNQDAMVAQILFMGNLTCDRRKSFYALRNKS